MNFVDHFTIVDPKKYFFSPLQTEPSAGGEEAETDAAADAEEARDKIKNVLGRRQR